MSAQRVLVTGANGPLGMRVAEQLALSGAAVTGLSRKAAPPGVSGAWITCDLLQQDALMAALRSHDTVVHCASNVQSPEDDIAVLDNLLLASSSSGKLHIVYVSICGIETAADNSTYYKMKLRNEAALEQSGLSHTIVRIAQFHEFVSMILSHLVYGPLLLTPIVTLQPVDLDFAAQELASIVLGKLQGRAPDVHGPETLTLREMAATWSAVRGYRKLRVWMPAFGLLKGFAGLARVHGTSGGRTWSQWLASVPAKSNPYGER